MRSTLRGPGTATVLLLFLLLAGPALGAPASAQSGGELAGDTAVAGDSTDAPGDSVMATADTVEDRWERALESVDSAGASSEIGPLPELPAAAPVPFGPGERLEYQVKMGVFSVGSGSLSVVGIETVHAHPTYRLVMELQGGIPMARVDDRFQSWLDVETLISRRFVQRIREAGYESDRHYEILPDEDRWVRADEPDNTGEMPTSFPLDDVSFLYYVRTLDLTPGKEYRFRRYFKEDGNPVVVKVVGRDTVEVPAGTFETVVVRPVIQTDGLFSEGGEAELHFTDDEDRYLVYMRVKIPVVRSMTLHLEEIHPGRSLVAEGAETSGGGEAGASDEGGDGEPR